MYPETDIPPIQLTEEHINKIRQYLPELPEQRLQRLMREYGLNQKLAKQLMDSEYAELFETIVKESQVSPTTVAAFLTETLKALKRDGAPVEKLSENQIREIFKALGSGEITKEALPEVAAWLSKNEGKTLKEAIESLDLKILSKEELVKTIDSVIENNKSLIKERGSKALGILMGLIMKEVRGKADASMISEILTKKLEKLVKVEDQ
jgi:glutamyl-tRNA(Gln) amidotransferase subunit E